MGVFKDLGTDFVDSICSKTGYPKNKDGFLLNPYSPITGDLEEGWDKKGTKLYNLTNPYGLLEYAVGEAEDFWCFDYAVIRLSTSSAFIVLDATINSETGGFIENADYKIIHSMDFENQSMDMIRAALSWCEENEIQHDKSGWNQDPYYFHRMVNVEIEKMMHPEPSDLQFTEKQFRFGGDGIDNFIYNSKDEDSVTPR